MTSAATIKNSAAVVGFRLLWYPYRVLGPWPAELRIGRVKQDPLDAWARVSPDSGDGKHNP
jgi:hypothetical protein